MSVPISEIRDPRVLKVRLEMEQWEKLEKEKEDKLRKLGFDPKPSTPSMPVSRHQFLEEYEEDTGWAG